jgi:uncharacterized Fe-S cluster protein YjdI
MSKLLQVFEHEGLTVTFDARRCYHAAECVRHLPAVFDSSARPWIRPERADAQAIIATVHRCPSGALRVSREGTPIDIATDGLSVRVARNGPLELRGDVRLVYEDGTVVAEDSRVSLCRCGESRRKPLCDGTHRSCGFKDP